MRHKAFILTCAALLLALTSVLAQHTPGAKFDLAKSVTLKGVVTQIDWSNPYSHVLVKVADGSRPALWAVELDGSIALERNGWSAEALPIGDTVTVQGFPSRATGSKQVLANSITTSSGKKVFSGTN